MSAPALRCTSPNAASRWRWSTAAAPGRGLPTAIPESSKATPFFRRSSRRAGGRCCALRSIGRRKRIIIWRFCRWSRLGCWRFAPRRGRSGWSRPRTPCGHCSRAPSASTRRLPPKPARTNYLRHNGWLKLYRSDQSFAGTRRELDLAASFGIANVPLDRDGALALEPSLQPVFRHAVHWTGAVSVTNPLALTRAYAARYAALGGLSFTGDAQIAPSHRRRTGASTPPRVRSTPATSWLRSDRGRRICSGRSASSCRLPSSAAITATTVRKAMPD